MKCQSLFSGKNKKNIISLSSAEFAHITVKFKRNFNEFNKLPHSQYNKIFFFSLN